MAVVPLDAVDDDLGVRVPAREVDDECAAEEVAHAAVAAELLRVRDDELAARARGEGRSGVRGGRGRGGRDRGGERTAEDARGGGRGSCGCRHAVPVWRRPRELYWLDES